MYRRSKLIPVHFPTHPMTFSKITNGSRSVTITGNEKDGSFYSFLVLNNGETVTNTHASHSTKAGAIRWANKTLAL